LNHPTDKSQSQWSRNDLIRHEAMPNEKLARSAPLHQANGDDKAFWRIRTRPKSIAQ